MARRIGLTVLLALLLLVAVVIGRTVMFTAEPLPADTTPLTQRPDIANVVEHLSQAIRFKTLSHEDPTHADTAAFDEFIRWLEATYPQVHRQAELTPINQYTRLYRWPGKDSAGAPVLFSAHYDVVPVNPQTRQNWTHPPFAGVVENGVIWGRGALDDKSAVVALMESMETAMAAGFTPSRDIYVALTHDEESGSELGAKAVTQWFADQHIKLAWSLDEGSFVLDGLVPGMDKPIASINVAEKGFLTLTLTAHGQGGHSSMPPKDTAVSTLARAITRVQDAPLPGGMQGVTATMYSNIAKHMDFTKRLLFANTWLFGPVIEQVVGQSASGNAMLRTTTAPTMLSGSIKANVLPDTATAKINFRLHPRDSVDTVVSWVRQVVNDHTIDVTVDEGFEPSAVAPDDNQAFTLLSQAAARVYPDSIITPGLTIAATDSHHYATITDAYRFNPMVINNDDLEGFHGVNERITVENMENAVLFYSSLMRNL